MTIKTLVELAQAIEDGKDIEYLCSNLWTGFQHCGHGFHRIHHDVLKGKLRIKQEPKKIDLSFLVGSGVDCEFFDEPIMESPKFVGRLIGMSDDGSQYHTEYGDQYYFCRPRMNHWHSVYNLKDLSFHQVLENAGFELEFMGGNDTPVEAFKITGTKKNYIL